MQVDIQTCQHKHIASGCLVAQSSQIKINQGFDTWNIDLMAPTFRKTALSVHILSASLQKRMPLDIKRQKRVLRTTCLLPRARQKTRGDRRKHSRIILSVFSENAPGRPRELSTRTFPNLPKPTHIIYAAISYIFFNI